MVEKIEGKHQNKKRKVMMMKIVGRYRMQKSKCWRWLLLVVEGQKHRWELPILHYHKIMSIYPYHFLV